MRVPIAGGPSEFVLEAKMNNYRCTKSPAGLCVFCELSKDRKQLIFTTLDPLKGRGKELVRYDADPDAWGYDWEILPDNNSIAIRKNFEPRLDIISVHGGAPRSLTVKGWNTLVNLNWAINGQGFFTSGILQQGSVLLYVDLERQCFPVVGAAR